MSNAKNTIRRARAYAGKYMADQGPLPATAATILATCAGCVRSPRDEELALIAGLVNTWDQHGGRWDVLGACTEGAYDE